MLKNIKNLGSKLSKVDQKSINGGKKAIGFCVSNCTKNGADCSLMFGPKKTCHDIPCDGGRVLACY